MGQQVKGREVESLEGDGGEGGPPQRQGPGLLVPDASRPQAEANCGATQRGNPFSFLQPGGTRKNSAVSPH